MKLFKSNGIKTYFKGIGGKYNRILGYLLVAILFFAAIPVIYKIFQGKESSSKEISTTEVTASPLPTPPPGQRPSGSETFPFQELTIPYLRQRTYETKLGDMEKVVENSGFTSYVTSYGSDGLKINGLLTVPQGEMPDSKWPAVVFVHGYIVPERYQTQVNYISWINSLAKNGFVVFKIDLRGHGDSEGEPGGGYYSSDYVIDTLNAYSALQHADFIDPGRIGLWGHSMAGNIVLRSLAAKPNIPAVVIWAGAGYTYTDLQEYSIHDNSFEPRPTGSESTRKRRELNETYGSFDPDNWFWKQVPATNYLTDIKGAIQLDQAVDDPVVSIQYSRNLNNLLNQTSIIHELYEYPSGGHNMTGSTFNQAMEKTASFFKKYLSN